MSDYGIFESIEGSSSERKIATRQTQRKLDAAIDDVKSQYGSFLYASRDTEEWNDRVALCKDDMIRTVNAHLMPVTGVMRRIVKACKDEWRLRVAQDEFSYGSGEPVDKGVTDGPAPSGEVGYDLGQADHVDHVHASRRRSDKTGPAMDNDQIFSPKKDKDLKPKGDFDAYLNKVDQNSDAAVDNCFKEGFYRHAEGGVGAAPSEPEPAGMNGGGVDPVAQASATPVSIPGIQAARYFYAETEQEKRQRQILDQAAAAGYTPTDPGKFPTSIGRPSNNPYGGVEVSQVVPGKAVLPPGEKPGSMSGGSPNDPQAFKDLSKVGPAAKTVNQPQNNATPAKAVTQPQNNATPKGGGGSASSGGGGGGSGWQENNLTDAINTEKYTVQQGDTLSDIAQRSGWGTNYKGLAEAAGIKNPDQINVGQEYNLGKPKGMEGGNDSRDLSTAGGKWGAPAPQSADAAKAGMDAFKAAPAPAPAAAPAAGTPPAAATPPANQQKAGSLALGQYIDWCDSFGYRRASINNLDIYAQNLNDRAYFEIASAITDPSSPIYREAISMGGPGKHSVEEDGPTAGGYESDPDYLKDELGRRRVPKGLGGPGKSRGASIHTAAPDYLQKADEALTNLLNQRAEEFQQTIAPLQQALQTVQQAEALQQAQNPLGVQPPAGTVNVLPGQGDPSGGGGDGGDPMAAAQALAGMGGGGGMPPGGGDPSMGGGGMDPSQMQMQARRKRGGQGKARGAKRPIQADVAGDFTKWMGTRGPGAVQNVTDAQSFSEAQGYKQRGMNALQSHNGPDALVDAATPKKKNKMPGAVTPTAPKAPKGAPKTANFFTRKVAGWQWDDHLNGYLANKPTPFTCKCGSKHKVPSYSTCKCGKIWNSYVIGTGGDRHQAAVEKFICREIPVRDNVIVAQRKTADCNCWKGYERVPGTKPCAEGSCRKCDSHRKKESGKVKRHNLSDPGPLGEGKDDKMPDISPDLGKKWYQHGPGGKFVGNG